MLISEKLKAFDYEINRRNILISKGSYKESVEFHQSA